MIVTEHFDRILNRTFWMKNLGRVRKRAKSLISFKNVRHSTLFKERYVFNGLLVLKPNLNKQNPLKTTQFQYLK